MGNAEYMGTQVHSIVKLQETEVRSKNKDIVV